jgi:hypothetical protein
MAKRSLTPILVACVAVSVACGTERGVESSVEPERPAVLTRLEVPPTVADLFASPPDDTITLTIVASDQRGAPMRGVGGVTFSSDAPAIARVSSSGIVTAAAPGTAVITATLTVAGITRTASMTATVHDPDEYPEIAGVYDLTAPITSFDPAWEDLTGYRYTAVLTLSQHNGRRFEGTYADLQVVRPGESSERKLTGFVSGSVDRDGRVIMELVGGNHTWTSWYGRGMLASGKIDGTFGCCGHISGTFTVARREGD